MNFKHSASEALDYYCKQTSCALKQLVWALLH